MKIFYYTNTGKMRKNNEDGLIIKCKEKEFVFCDTSFEFPKTSTKECDVFVVSDGMGATEKGEIATKFLLRNLKKSDFENEAQLIEILKLTIKELEENRIEGGSALAGIKIKDDFMNIFNVGDCRVYKKSRNYAKRISKDHSFVEELIDAGILSPYEAHNHPKSNILTSSIMPHKDFKLFFKTEMFKKGNIFLICSDGVWAELSIEELDECFEKNSIQEINEAIFFALQEKKQKDNLTYILIEA